ncbi:MAG: LacI family DNA-binding transcriptional regulator, partial [Acidimicrobiales bacterium]
MKPLTYGLPDEGARQGARATIYDVARTAGVSPATVSRFLNGTARVAVSTQRRIEDAVRAHAFAPNAIAQSLATRASKTIAVLVPDITNPFFPELVKGVQEHAEERDFALVLSDTGSRIERELRYLEVARRKQVDGVILVSARMPEELLEGLPEQGITAVAIDPRRERPGQMSISLSHGLGAARATEHLIELGHLRIAHLCGPKGIHASRERLTGFRTAMARAGITVSAAAVVQAGFTEESGRRGVELLLEREVPFSALFAANDLCAIGAIDYLQKQGLHVPGDVSVIGIDGISL